MPHGRGQSSRHGEDSINMKHYHLLGNAKRSQSISSVDYVKAFIKREACAIAPCLHDHSIVIERQ